MKLIKQNDSVGGLIFKQNNNGKAMKQNYNFGKGFFDGGIGAYIQCPSNIIDPRDEFSIIGFIDVGPIAVQADPLFQILGDGSQIAALRVLRGTSKVDAIGMLSEPSVGTNWYDEDKLIVGVSLSLSSGMIITPKGAVASSRVSVPNHTEYTINLYRSDASGGYPIGLIREKANDLLIYNRAITQDEWNYFYNNKLGNDPLSTLGLKAYYKHGAYEILPFEGSDAVCTRDYSGNNSHAKIIGLPAGPLQDQLVYANNNLLKL